MGSIICAHQVGSGWRLHERTSKKTHTNDWLVNLKISDHSENVVVCGRIIMKYIVGKHDVRAWIGFLWLWVWMLVESCNTIMKPRFE